MRLHAQAAFGDLEAGPPRVPDPCEQELALSFSLATAKGSLHDPVPFVLRLLGSLLPGLSEAIPQSHHLGLREVRDLGATLGVTNEVELLLADTHTLKHAEKLPKT